LSYVDLYRKWRAGNSSSKVTIWQRGKNVYIIIRFSALPAENLTF